MSSGARKTGRGLSLRWRMIIGSVLVEAVMLSLLVYNSMRLIEHSLTEQVELRLREVSVLLSAAVGPSMAAQDYGPVHDVFAATRREQGISYLVAWDTEGRRVAINGWPDESTLPAPTTDLAEALRLERIDERVEVTVNERRYGVLQFGVSTQFLADARSQLVRQSLLIAGGEVLLSALLLALLSIWLTRHLKQLEDASAAFAAGHFDKPLHIQSDDEIGHLARAFNTMRDEISARIEALHQSEERFRSLSALSSDWVWEQDADYRFTRLDGAFGAMVSLRDKLLGQRRWDLADLLTEPGHMAAHKADVMAHRAFRDFEYRVMGLDGARYFSASGEPVFDAQGVFKGYRGTGKDITARKRAEAAIEASERKFSSLFQLSPLPMALSESETGRIVLVNEAWLGLFGFDVDAVLGHGVADLALFAHPAELLAFEAAMRRNESCQLVDARLRAQDGRALVCALTGRTLDQRAFKLFLWCVRDVTAERAADAKILEINSELELRVEQRTRDLADKVEQLHRTQDQLVQSEKLAALGRVVAGVAHELNTPLGNMLMTASALRHEALGMRGVFEQGSMRRNQLGEFLVRVESASELLERGAGRAAELVASFKRVSVDQESLQRRSFALNQVVHDTQRMLEPSLRRKQVRWRIEVPESLVLDSYPGPLEQVLTNLVQNAALHGIVESRPLTVECTARLADRAVPGLELLIRDDGAGMSEAVVRQAFDPYFTTRFGQGGSGLGLYIVYGLVTGPLGGEIKLHSRLGEGCCFTLWLPLQAPDAATA